MNIVVLDSEAWEKLGKEKSQTLRETVTNAANEAAKILHGYISDHVNLVFHATESWDVIPETGDMGYTHNKDVVRVYFDPALPHGFEKLKKHLAETTFHELHHAARFNAVDDANTLIVGAVLEGLATVFEREYSGSKPLWGEYEDDETMRNWFAEIVEAGHDWSKRDGLFFEHTDGRKWIAYKTGTWIIDKALKNSNKSLLDLTPMPTADILRLNGLK